MHHGCRQTAARQTRQADRLARPDATVAYQRPQNHAHEDVYVAIRDAFNFAGRRLEDHARKIRGQVKRRQPQPDSRPG